MLTDGSASRLAMMSTFSKRRFDYALLALLDVDYHVAEIWRAEHAQVANPIKKEKRRNPNLTSFQDKAKLFWRLV